MQYASSTYRNRKKMDRKNGRTSRKILKRSNIFTITATTANAPPSRGKYTKKKKWTQKKMEYIASAVPTLDFLNTYCLKDKEKILKNATRSNRAAEKGVLKPMRTK